MDGDGNMDPGEWASYLAELGDNFEKKESNNNSQQGSAKHQAGCLVSIIPLIVFAALMLMWIIR